MDEDRFLLFHQVGTGKTLSGIILCDNLLSFGYKNVVIYTPGPLLKKVWEKTLEAYFSNLPEVIKNAKLKQFQVHTRQHLIKQIHDLINKQK